MKRLLPILFMISLLLLGSSHPVEALSGKKPVNIGSKYTCWKITELELSKIGYLTLKFERNAIYWQSQPYWDQFCSANKIYNVTTSPKDQIRGAKGVRGQTPKNIFYIQVTSETTAIYIKYSRGSRENLSVGSLTYNISIYLDSFLEHLKAEQSSPSWQKAFKASESKLEAQAKADKTPPRISVFSPKVGKGQEAISVDTYKANVRGRVTDNEGVMTVMVNGRKAGVKADGTFAARVKLAFGTNKISVQAEDIHGNIAEKKFTIIREEFIPEQTLADVDMPPKTRMNNPNGVAVVIGVENYQYVSDATFAYNDAEVFREYLADTLGYKKSKIKIVTNSKATLAELNKLLGPNGWIARNVKAKISDVVVYFSGHGIPDAKSKKTGLLPFDVDPNYSVGMTLRDLYATLGTLDAKSVTVFLDTCFSGQGREKQSLLADARGIMVVPLETNVPKPMTVLSAATAGQISGPLKDKEHGLFTYYVLKGLGGAADSNKDKQLTISELGSYVQANVKEQAAAKGWNQTPELQGASNRVLVRF